MERRKNPIIRGTGALWSYIDVRDAARACRLALEANFAGHQTFNICAPDTIMDMPTAEFAAKYLPQVQIRAQSRRAMERLRYREGGKDIGLSRQVVTAQLRRRHFLRCLNNLNRDTVYFSNLIQ